MVTLESKPNYLVSINDWYGHREVECNSEEEVRETIGSVIFGGLYVVSSPVGLDIGETFIPF